MRGTVWIVATPLGNLGDLSPRARETLERVGVVLAEDTRRTGQLLQLAGISGKRLLSLHEHNEEERLGEVLDLLAAGTDAAVVSDAGTPLIADPGYRLVAACRERGLTVSPVPGPCAPIAALMGSGLPPYPFVFLGFLPRREGEIRALFRQYADLQATLVFFERKNRIARTLEVAGEVLGERDFCLARELTKKHEQFINGRLGEPLADPDGLRGELTVVIGPPQAATSSREEVEGLIRDMAGQGLSPRDMARTIRSRTTGWTAKDIYALVLERGAK
ncbi:MAG: 16S rRNA (cytidine(1402)-2'-O)-methyltransferase [Pseudomonadota bacterium]|nr:16S rRNA (cytidine(1402)-2'-O)-methyltransferase [Pseudomonadota bacterium]